MRIPDPFEESVGGHVIGSYLSVGRLYYEGRPQGEQLYADNDDELKAIAEERLTLRKESTGESFRETYPNAGGWELRIFG